MAFGRACGCAGEGELFTSSGRYCLPGITRRAILEVARTAGITAHETDFSLTAVYAADEAFVTGTFAGVTHVRQVDGRDIGDRKLGPVTARLRDLYEDLVLEEALGT